MPAPDPALHREPAHDVLAAEEFGMPARDPVLHHGPVTLPSDPTGIAEPHDVLAAEEFAMPAPRGVRRRCGHSPRLGTRRARAGRRGAGAPCNVPVAQTSQLKSQTRLVSSRRGRDHGPRDAI